MATAEQDMRIIRYITEGTINLGAAGAEQTSLRVLEYEAKPMIGKKENRDLDDDKQRNAPRKSSIYYDVKLKVRLRYGELDSFFAAAFRDAAWSAAVDVTDTVYDVSSVDNSINDSGSGFVGDGYLANQLLRTSGFTTAANNSLGKISTVAAAKMVMLAIDFTTEVAGDSVTVDMGSQIVPGSTIATFAFEEELSDLGGIFTETRGCALSSLTLSINNDDEVIADLSFIGISQATAAVTYGDGTPAAASTNEVLMYDQLDLIYENNGVITLSNAFSITFNPKLRPIDFLLGTDSITEFKCGDWECDGSIEYLLPNMTIYNKVAACTESSLIFYMADSSGNGYGFEIVALQYDDISRNNDKENDILMTAAFRGHKDTTEDIMARMARFPA